MAIESMDETKQFTKNFANANSLCFIPVVLYIQIVFVSRGIEYKAIINPKYASAT